jgi:hypothetical protein
MRLRLRGASLQVEAALDEFPAELIGVLEVDGIEALGPGGLDVAEAIVDEYAFVVAIQVVGIVQEAVDGRVGLLELHLTGDHDFLE